MYHLPSPAVLGGDCDKCWTAGLMLPLDSWCHLFKLYICVLIINDQEAYGNSK